MAPEMFSAFNIMSGPPAPEGGVEGELFVGICSCIIEVLDLGVWCIVLGFYFGLKVKPIAIQRGCVYNRVTLSAKIRSLAKA